MLKTLKSSLIVGVLSLLGSATIVKAGFEDALLAVAEEDWEVAREEVEGAVAVARDLIRWYELRAEVGTFRDYLDFLTENGNWPGLVQLRRAGELTIDGHTPAKDVLQYFGNRHAGTAHGALYLASALNAGGKYQEAREEIVLAWRMLSFSRSEQAIFQKEFAEIVRPHNFARLDRLLWRGQNDQAERMFPFLTPGERALARARIALREKSKGVDSKIKAIPKGLQDDPGLAFERYIWRLDKGFGKSAQKLIIERSASAESLGNPSYWSSTRRTLARNALRSGRHKLAYELASNHHLIRGNDFADLEWLSGYIALKHLDDPALSLRHFRRYRAGVESPISMGRAAYWEAEAYTALDRPDDAFVMLEFGSEFQTGFYGLLAAEKAGAGMQEQLFLPAREGLGDDLLMEDSRIKAGLLLAQSGDKSQGARFFAHVFDRVPSEQQRRLAQLAADLGEYHISVTLAKLGATRGEVMVQPYFPVMDLADGDVPGPLVHAVIRKESEFNPNAVSRVGALGLMQLMPGTAKEVAGDLDVKYDKPALTGDPGYNIQLGTEYLRFLIDEFDGNVLLVASAYNAGPGRTRQWLKSLGDPRKKSVDPLDWIESIPFRETRNYVMRIAEAVVVYRARMSGTAQPIGLSGELKGSLND